MQLAEVLREENGDNLIPGQEVTFNQLPYSDDGSSETWEDFCTRMSEAEYNNSFTFALLSLHFISCRIYDQYWRYYWYIRVRRGAVFAAAAVLLNRQINVVTLTLTGVTNSPYFPSGNANSLLLGI